MFEGATEDDYIPWSPPLLQHSEMTMAQTKRALESVRRVSAEQLRILAKIDRKYSTQMPDLEDLFQDARVASSAGFCSTRFFYFLARWLHGLFQTASICGCICCPCWLALQCCYCCHRRREINLIQEALQQPPMQQPLLA